LDLCTLVAGTRRTTWWIQDLLLQVVPPPPPSRSVFYRFFDADNMPAEGVGGGGGGANEVKMNQCDSSSMHAVRLELYGDIHDDKSRAAGGCETLMPIE
jgi:hypothetical protein